MSQIAERIQDAEELWRIGRRDGALLMILCAIDAAASAGTQSNKGAAFKTFLNEDAMPMSMKVEYQGGLRSLAEIFWHVLRCELVHEGGLPDDVKIVQIAEDMDENSCSVRAGGAPDFTLLLSPGWFYLLVNRAKTSLLI
jgi:hypothetical protein